MRFQGFGTDTTATVRQTGLKWNPFKAKIKNRLWTAPK